MSLVEPPAAAANTARLAPVLIGGLAAVVLLAFWVARRNDPSHVRPTAESDPSATLTVLVRSVESGAAVPGVRLWLSRDSSEGCSDHSQLQGSEAVFGESPLTDAQGRARFRVPVGVPFQLRTWGEDGLCGPAGLRVPALLVGETRELHFEVVTSAPKLLPDEG